MQSVPNTSRLKGYIYKGIEFDSSWELAYYLYLTDHKIPFIYHPKLSFNYKDEKGKDHTYWPDFLVEGQFIEIKGDQFFNEKGEPYCRYTKNFWWNKYTALINNNIKILKLEDMRQYLKYINTTYGNNYLKSYKIEQSSETIPKGSTLK